MKHSTLLSAALALSLGLSALSGQAQSNQIGQPVNAYFGGITGSYFSVWGNAGPNCGVLNYRYTISDPAAPWGSDYGSTATYYSLPAGKGPQSFTVTFNYSAASTETPNYQVFVDGQYCPSCVATLNSHAVNGIPGVTDVTIQDNIVITHQAGDAWAEPNNGVREFGLRYRIGNTPYADIRFKVVMVGTVITEVLGHYDAPALPLYILRDPPGGTSFSSLTLDHGACLGQSRSVTSGETDAGFFKARLGAKGEIGFGIELDYEIYAEVGIDLSTTHTSTTTFDNQTCLTTSSEFTTSNDGTPDDVFIGSAVRYAYGMAKIIERPTCGVVNKSAYMASAPEHVNSSYHLNESYIREHVIPDYEDSVSTYTPGSILYKNAENQLSVWRQTLALNDSIKASAPIQITRAFNGGGAGQTFSTTTTTETSKHIDYNVSLDAGLSFEFGVNIGGSGVSGGASVHMRDEYGKGESGTNSTTNTMLYHLEDSDVIDHHTVQVRTDNVFGTYVFTLDSANSATTCKYEGGYHVDNPELSVNTLGTTSMTVNEAPLGTAVNFPLILCNNSDYARTYYLKFSAITNTQGAIMQAFGNTLNSNDNGVQLLFQPHQCINTNLALTQPNLGVVDFDNINLYLYALCEENYAPYIRSFISISAHYGAGNFGNYCTPVSASGTTLGDFINGVQFLAINNTGTGGVAGPAYTDYTAQFSTPLSRNAQASVTITGGANAADHYAAWIDFDHNAVFDASEKLGEFQTQAAGEAQSIGFAVPSNAALGTTRMRVRGISGNLGEPMPVEPCFNYANGETEDYAVVINANTPQDCLGVNNGTALPGTACNDNNANTGNDTWNANCACVGVLMDCTGTPGGSALPGSACNDGDVTTGNDTYNASCVCAGLVIDCQGIPGGAALPWTSCDDGDPDTGNDFYFPNCICEGTAYDCQGTIGGGAVPGTTCNDGNPLSGGDAYNANCVCVGTFVTDCQGVENGTAQPGTACNDNDASTGADAYGANCVCAGLPYDCAGTAGGTQLPGAPCDDNNPETQNDHFTANCSCVGELANDCAGVPGGTAQPGTACDDGDASTGNDVYNAFCVCSGLTIDCNGTPGGTALPGFPCDDGNANTANDTLSTNCQCAGVLIDCEGVVGGGSTIGTACDDGNADTGNDTWNANCVCAGTLASDCNGVPGGTAQPGTACDDADANTGNDVYSANCVCAGTTIDCAGTVGGTALPGTTCDDGDACTTGDVYGNACTCVGTALQVSAINGPALIYTGTNNAYYVNPVPGATGYSWTMPNGWSSPSTTNFFLQADAGIGVGAFNLCVDANVGTCVLTTCLPVQVELSTGISTSSNTSEEWFTVQPNPSNGVFQLLPSTNDNTPIAITIHDGTGRQVMEAFTVVGKRAVPIDMGNMAAGAYYLLATRNGQHQAMKVMVQR